ncbi:MAG: hypothetical protein GQ574_08840 [Crocinitomix sp.]|nr:hypothetical protein [Crocinitomix sp.]
MRGLFISIFLTLLLFACNSNERVNITENHVPDNTIVIQDTMPILNLPQSENHILGDKMFFSKQEDQNGLTSPDTITVLGEFQDSIDAMKRLKQLLRKDTTVQFLNINTYYYTDNQSNYILYKKAIRNANESIYIPYKKTYRTDGDFEIYKIRRNNFEQDSSLVPTELPAFYSAYNVSSVIDSSLMVVEQKRYYWEARPFCRFMKYNSKKVQENSLTINDYELHAVLELTNDQLLIALAEPEFGIRFGYDIAKAKIIIIDKDLNILNEIEVFYKGAKLYTFFKKDESYFLGLKFHVPCSSCDLHHCYFQIELDENLQNQNVEITAYPEEYYVPLDSVLNNLRVTAPSK